MRQAALALACGCIVFAALGAVAQTSDRIVVPFSDPSKPGAVKINLLSGSITVTGYPGKEVLVVPSPGDEEDEEYTPRPPKPPRPPQAHKGRTPTPEAEPDEDPDDRAHGLHRVPNLSSGLTIDEQNNVVVISSEAWGNGVDLNVQVPVGTALDLATVNDGDIVVRNVDGEINAENTNGEVTLRDVSGSVVAHALNGDVVVTLQRIDPKRGMSFSSMNGDIDVTLPSTTKADVRIKSDNGEIYTDFDLQLGAHTESSPADGKDKPYKSKRHAIYESSMVGTLNGGGPTLRFETFNGNVYIRKAK
jgi:hypothetical protein